MKRLLFIILAISNGLHAMEPISATAVVAAAETVGTAAQSTAQAITSSLSSSERIATAQQTTQNSAIAETANQVTEQAESHVQETITQAGITSAIIKFALEGAKKLARNFALSYATQTMLQLHGAEADIFHYFSGNALECYLASQGANFLNQLERFNKCYKDVPGIKEYVTSMIDVSKQIIQAAKNGNHLLANALVDMQQATHAVVCEIMDYHDQSLLPRLTKQTLKFTKSMLFSKALSLIMPPDLAVILKLTDSLYAGLKAAKATNPEKINSYNQLLTKEKVAQFKNLFNEKNLTNSSEISNRTKNLVGKAFSSMQTYLKNIELPQKASISSTSAASNSGYSLSSFFAVAKKILKSPSDFLRQVEDYKDGIQTKNKPLEFAVGPTSSSSSNSLSMQQRMRLNQRLLHSGGYQMSVHSGIGNPRGSRSTNPRSSSSRRLKTRITKKASTKRSSEKNPIPDAKPVAIVQGSQGGWHLLRWFDGWHSAKLNKQQAINVAAALSKRGILVQVPDNMNVVPVEIPKIDESAQKANENLVENDQSLKDFVDDIAKNYTEPHRSSDYGFLGKTKPWDEANKANTDELFRKYTRPLSEVEIDIRSNEELNDRNFAQKHKEAFTKHSSLDEIQTNIAKLQEWRAKYNSQNFYHSGQTMADYYEGDIGYEMADRIPAYADKDLYSDIVQQAINKIDACLAHNNNLLKSHHAAVWKWKQRLGKGTQQELINKYQELQSQNTQQSYDDSKHAVSDAQSQVAQTSGGFYDLSQGIKNVGSTIKSWIWPSSSSQTLDPHIDAQNKLKESQKEHRSNAKALSDYDAQLEAVKQLLRESVIQQTQSIKYDARTIGNPTNNDTVQAYKGIAIDAAEAGAILANQSKFDLANHCIELGQEAVKAAAHCAKVIANNPGAFGGGFKNAYGNATKFQIGVGVAIYLGGGNLGGILKALKGMKYVHRAYLGKKLFDAVISKEILSDEFIAMTEEEQAAYLGQLTGHYVKAYEDKILQGIGYADEKLGGHMAKLFKRLQKLYVQEMKTWKNIGKNSTALARKQDVQNWVNNRLTSMKAQLGKLTNEQFGKLQKAIQELKSKTRGAFNKGPVYVVDANGTIRMSPDNFNTIWLSEMDKEVIKEAARRGKNAVDQASSSLLASAKQAQKVIKDLKHVAAPKVVPSSKDPMTAMQQLEQQEIAKGEQTGFPIEKVGDGVMAFETVDARGNKTWRTIVLSPDAQLDGLYRYDGYVHTFYGEVSVKGYLKGQHQGKYGKLQPMIKKILKVADKNGVYVVEWYIDGARKPKPSTMIPDSWSINDFSKAIKEVYQNPIEIKQSRGRLLIHGKCKRGIPFRLVVEKKLINGQIRDKLVTAFPFHDSELPACFQ